MKISLMKKFLFFIILLCYSIYIHTQEFVIPFQEDSWAFIELKINDSNESLSFVFDTGASSTVINKTTAERLGIKTNLQRNVSGANGNESYKIVKEQTIDIGDLHLGNLDLIIADLSHLQEHTDIPMDGIIGYDIIKKFVTKLNFEEQKIELYESANSVPDLDSYNKIRIKSNRTIPQLLLNIELENGKSLKGKFFFDSGASTTVILNSPYVKKHKVIEEIGKTYEKKSSGLSSNKITNNIGIVKSLKLDETTFQNVPMTLSNAKYGVLAQKQVMGILGSEIISRFQVVLDYEKASLYLKPNKNRSKPFIRNYCGFTVAKRNGKIFIDNVIENTEAHTLGITAGDEILSINNYSDKSLKTVKDFLQNEGEIILLKILNASNIEKEHKLTLRKII